MHKTIAAAAGTIALGLAALPAAPAQAQDKYLAEIVVVATNFCPRGTLKADGSLLEIGKNMALFSLLGTVYGGDGRTTFALPDLRGKPVAANGRALLHCIVTEGIYPSRP
jgi:microcystin-dependent protein